jgi:type III pantothenate kinase
MILVVDVGNTNIKFGIVKDREILATFKMATDRGKTVDEYWFFLEVLAKRLDIDMASMDRVVICSVVPTLDPVFSSLSLRYFNKPALFVEPGIKTGITILTENPREVGADIVSATVGIVAFYSVPAILISFGTATVLTGISGRKELLGVSIAPGLTSSAEALFKNTSKLPRVDLKDPGIFLGKNSSESLQSGFYYGFQGLIHELIAGIKKEMNEESLTIIATGGLCSLISKSIPEINFIDQYLNLKGLSIIYEKNMENW